MLRNQESMSVERIHGMLKMISTGSSGSVRYDMTIVQLKKFLQHCVSADKLEMVDGEYRLRIQVS
jgi:hypothetical protein